VHDDLCAILNVWRSRMGRNVVMRKLACSPSKARGSQTPEAQRFRVRQLRKLLTPERVGVFLDLNVAAAPTPESVTTDYASPPLVLS
jgi:hypothetical protein